MCANVDLYSGFVYSALHIPLNIATPIEEFWEEIKNRGLEVPPFYGLALDDESVDMDRILSDFDAFVKSICQ